MDSFNSYEDSRRAEAYSKLEFPGTYYLAYRDLAEIILTHVKGRRGLDFGCGAGRSTRFLKKIGFAAVGVDISADMLKRAKEIDPEGAYQLIPDGDFSMFANQSMDLILSVFTFDNIPTLKKKVTIFREMSRLLKPEGRIVSLVSSPAIYTHEWTSFSTKDFPENKKARCGDAVKIINTAIADPRPVADILWPDQDYRDVYRQTGLKVVKVYKPLAKKEEPYPWVNETRIAPWVIYVLKKAP